MSGPYSERSIVTSQPCWQGFGETDQQGQLSLYTQQLQSEQWKGFQSNQKQSSADAHLPNVQLIHDITLHGKNGNEDVISGIKPMPGETLPQLIKRLHPDLSNAQLNQEVQHMLKYNKNYGNDLGDGSQLDPNKTVYLTSVEYTDAQRRPTKIESPNGQVTEIAYDGSGMAGYKITAPDGTISEQVTRGSTGQWLILRADGTQVAINNLTVDCQGNITARQANGNKIGHRTRGDEIYTRCQNSRPIQAMLERNGKTIGLYRFTPDSNGNSGQASITYQDNEGQPVALDKSSEALRRAEIGQGGSRDSANSEGSGDSGNSGICSALGSTTYDGADSSGVSQQTVEQNAQIVAQVARQDGVNPVTAVASMLVESGGDNRIVGDDGTSFGLFQLHEGGELGSLTEHQADDPVTNAQVALAVFKSNEAATSDPGTLAAISQRPADQASYARDVDAHLAQARQLLGMA